ncbi:follistatin-related protein 4-like [Dendronephthya gigantea]|uniref:follistatin-related protein 4-like n=1 Tax=Dendronephthya gigantea TaxID=151771 RepID=UPI00106DB32A|nr:follistatin-related protein 4-like [Dendronephthya gigantea]
MTPRLLLQILVIYGILHGHSITASADIGNVFYVLGTDGIYVIDPVAKSVVANITDKTAPGLCTKRSGSSDICSFGLACAVHETVFVADRSGRAVHLIDIKTYKKIKTIQTDSSPFEMLCMPWRKEVWVSLSSGGFDVIDTEHRTSTRVAHAQLPNDDRDRILADQNMLEGKTGFVTTLKDSGIHELNLETKDYTRFRNFSRYGCSGTYGQSIVYNSYNKQVYMRCKINENATLALDTLSGATKKWFISGYPFVSPNGRYVVITDAINRIDILTVNKTGFKASHAKLAIPNGVSNPVFYPKSNSSVSYYVFFSLDHADKMMVVDLDLAKNGNISAVKYIEGVNSFFGRFYNLFINDKWIIYVVDADNTVVIINAETQKIHGKIKGVNGGHWAVWVSRPSASATSEPTMTTTNGNSGIGRPSCFTFLVFLHVFIQL